MACKITSVDILSDALYFRESMETSQKPNLFQQLLAKKTAAQKAGHAGIVGNADLSRQFRPGEKPQPQIRRGGRNGSGKP